MKAATIKLAKITTIHLILLLMTFAYGMNTYAKGQPYVPPQKHHCCCNQ